MDDATEHHCRIGSLHLQLTSYSFVFRDPFAECVTKYKLGSSHLLSHTRDTHHQSEQQEPAPPMTALIQKHIDTMFKPTRPESQEQAYAILRQKTFQLVMSSDSAISLIESPFFMSLIDAARELPPVKGDIGIEHKQYLNGVSFDHLLNSSHEDLRAKLRSEAETALGISIAADLCSSPQELFGHHCQNDSF
jgi:hypothetical protein